jgi:enolase
MKIQEIATNKILDGNGCFVVEVKLLLSDGRLIEASIPLLGNQDGHQGVANEVQEEIEKIFVKIRGIKIEKDFAVQIDDLLMKLKNKDKEINKQACLLLSVACARAAAVVNEQELFSYLDEAYKFNQKIFDFPIPIFTMFNGGIYGDTNLDFEEFLIIPLGKNRTSFLEKVEKGVNIFHELSKVLRESGFDTDVGVHGGYAPDINSTIQAIDLITFAISRAGYNHGEEIGLGLNIGSSHLYSKQGGKYIFRLDESTFTSDSLIELYKQWADTYPLIYLEDCLESNDIQGWAEMTRELRDELILAGDSLFGNKIDNLRRGLKDHLANTVVVKLENFYTIQEMTDYIKLAQKHNYKIAISHSTGETNDDFIADLSVAVDANFIKSGSLSRGERVSKYNRLIEIERQVV